MIGMVDLPPWEGSFLRLRGYKVRYPHPTRHGFSPFRGVFLFLLLSRGKLLVVLHSKRTGQTKTRRSFPFFVLAVRTTCPSWADAPGCCRLSLFFALRIS